MDMFYNLSITKKFLALFAAVFLGMGFIATYSINSLFNSNILANEINDMIDNSYTHTTNAYTAIINFDKALNTNVSADNLGEVNINQFTTLLHQLEDHIHKLEQADKSAKVMKIDENVQKLAQSVEQDIIPALTQQKNLEQAYDNYHKITSHICNDLTSLIDSLITDQMHFCQRGIEHLRSFTPIIVISTITIGTIFFLLIFAFFASKDIVSNTNEVAVHAKAISEGNLSTPINSKRKDEFGQLLNHFEEMRIALRIKVKEVYDNMEKITKNNTDVLAKTDRVVNLVKHTEGAVITVATATDEMEHTTRDIAQNCETASKDAQQSHAITQTGMNSVNTTVKSIHLQADQTKKDSDIILRLLEQSHNIDSIVETIDDIAAQTNLLALNAAIEAARAGEAGRGFSVVADEVRALAQRTTNSTHQITSMVESIKKDANAASESMTKSVSGINNLASDSATIDSNLHEIFDNVSNVSMRIEQIASAAEQQTTASGEISNSMRDVTTATHDILEHSEDSISLVKLTDNSIQDLHKSMSFFKL